MHLTGGCPAAENVQPNKPHKDLPQDAGQHTIARLDQIRNSKGSLHTAEIRRNMQRIMQVSLCCAGFVIPVFLVDALTVDTSCTQEVCADSASAVGA